MLHLYICFIIFDFSMLRQIHFFLLAVINRILNGLYPLFSPLMPVGQFRYAACGGGNMALNILIYFVTYNFLLRKSMVDLSVVVISPHIASFLIAFAVTFPIGFYLSLFVVFDGSYLKRRVQLFRYFLVAMQCIVLNYIFLKLFVEQFGWYPTPSAIVTTLIITIFSYLMQRHFSFRKQRRKAFVAVPVAEGR